MARAVNANDWERTPLGPVSAWPSCIRTAVSICLGSHFQLMVLAGSDLIYIYNDACIPIFGDKHPAALGRRVADVWPEAWETIAPVLGSVLETGERVRQDDWPLMLNRSGFAEECFFTLSYSPISPDAGSAAGVFVAVMETTRRVLGERRQRTLSELAIQVALGRGGDRTFDLVRQALAANGSDLPLAALYLAGPAHQPGSGDVDAVFCIGLHEGCAGIDQRIAWGGEAHPLACLTGLTGLTGLTSAAGPQLYDFEELFGRANTCGAWPEPPRQVIALALPGGGGTPRGFVLVALNPRAPFDDDYRQFIDAMAGLVASAVASVDAAAFEVERARATAELERSKHDLANVLAKTSDAFVSVDFELRLLTLNDAAVASLGGAREELVGRSFVELLPATVAMMLGPALRAALAGGEPVEVEVCNPRSARWFNVRCYPAPQGLLVFGNDITERRDAERLQERAKRELERRFDLRTEELREANRLLAAVFDRAPGGIAITDTLGRFVRANPAYQALAGVTEQALLGRTVADLTVASDYPAAAEKIAALEGGAVDSAQMEVRCRRADGSVIWIHNFVSIIADGAGRARYFVHVASDITERKRVEAGRRAAQDELNVLYQRLQTVREAERTALAREVHDQLGQILSAAKIDVKLLEGDIRVHGTALAPEKIIAELHSAGVTLDRAMQLVRDIATELRAPELDGQGLYAAIEWHARDFERRTRVSVHLELGAGLAQPVRAAGEALLRIFHEALTNVLRHAHASCVWVSVEQRGAALLLRVRDDGSGIARQRARAVCFDGSLGIIGMRERAALAHGRLRVGPLTPRGTLVSALIPMFTQEILPVLPGAGSGAPP
ncbi:hypothetical protein GCM10008020_20430 [Massilia psychrophila]|nr:hypothetical protein GCM10008020_20430 [Massilia psychrophila]